MEAEQIVVLSLLQGLTEFLPISSSAHLILLPHFLDWPDQGLAFDVAVHVGTLLAVIGYFRWELIHMGRDMYRSVAERRQVGSSLLAWGVILGTIPVGLGGLFLSRFGTDFLRDPLIIASTTTFFALVLWWVDHTGARIRDENTLRWSDILVIGLAQTLALIPGTSRAGITLSAGLALGLTRAGAARFSFLLAIPTIMLAGGLTGIEAWNHRAIVGWTPLLTGTLLAAISAYLGIHFFLRLLERVGLLPFILYRLLLGVILFVYFGL
uniref:Undecaprenyl-diphosphatase n=1 Tax=Candidatus Kentrum sp. TUN TaxID=2126343 RepID=A0A451AGJ4_9GAMM|nr:MAG: undecaprenyl-diphosphatase [Candidatus Kentron sp. TUN]VFK60089.1 MAG: undecaprenyl-diphosphatase [Candidatus Kentron sp. TUN]VFK65148.1 MAG: undecaprenyl-diphosphatase [Candidatus Kentron sp. TUN]